MRFGTKKVHRFFIDRHIPLYLRQTWPAVVNREQKVIMIPGLGCDVSHFSVSPDFNVLQLTGSYLK
jgi:tRNA(Ile)-lysidine synthase